MIQFFEIYVFEEDMKRENFMILAKKVDFANEILKYNCKSIVDSVSASGEFTELNLDQLIGTDDSRNTLTTWFDFLDGKGGGRFLPKDFGGSVHEQANKAEESLIHKGCKNSEVV